MPKSRLLVVAACLSLAAVSAGCKNKKGDTMPPLGVGPATDTGDTTASHRPVPDEEKIEIVASVSGLDDVLAGIKKFGESWMPGSAVDPAADMQAAALATGFGPGFFANLDMAGQHAVFIASPPGQAAPQDTSFAGNIAVVDAKKLIESTPQDYRPQPMGDGMWELNRDGQRVLFKEAGKELHLGYTTADLDRAAKLKGQIGKGHTLSARASNIPSDQLDPVALLGLPPDNPIVKGLAAVLQELAYVEVEADFGTTKDFSLVAGAKAPFHKLGLGPIGAPRATATALESRMPAGPVFVTTMSWGDPKLIQATLEKMVPLSMVPDAFRDMASKALQSVNTLLGQVANDIVLAMYVDAKGRATVVLAADVKDDAVTRTGLRSMNEVLVQGIDVQKLAAGKNKDQAFDAALKKDGVSVGKAKGDHLVVTIPKDFEADFSDMSAFLEKGKIETVTLVADNTAIIAIGAGAKALAADIGKSLGKARKQNLGQHAGLSLVRSSLGGCQICASGDPQAYFRFRLALLANAENKDVGKQAKTHLATLGKVSALGDPGVGVKVADDAASLAIVVPQGLLYAPTKSTETLTTIADFVSDPEAWLADNKGGASAPKK